MGTTKRIGAKRPALVVRLGVGWVFFFAALIATSTVGVSLAAPARSHLAEQAGEAVLFAVVAIPGVLLLRRFLDLRPIRTMGLSPARTAPLQVLAGCALTLGAAAVVVAAFASVGLLTITQVTLTPGILTACLVDVVISLLYEAIPEELFFRGYAYRNLSGVLPRWGAALVQLALFIAWGVAGQWLGTGDLSGIAQYVVYLAIFGSAVQLCRIATGAIWTGVGVHVAQLEISRYLIGGAGGGVVVHFSAASPYTTVVYPAFFVLVALSVLLWTRLRRRPIGWSRIDPDLA